MSSLHVDFFQALQRILKALSMHKYTALAHKLRKAGINAMPTRIIKNSDGSIRTDKAPKVKTWTHLQSQAITEAETKSLFKNLKPTEHIGIVTGFGGVECIDIDDPTVNNDFLQRMLDWVGLDVYKKIYIEETQKGGLHIIYKCADPLSKQHLSKSEKRHKKHKRTGELEYNEDGTPIMSPSIICEAVGFVVVAPSKGYKKIQGDLSALPMLSDKDRDAIRLIARSYHVEEAQLSTNSKPNHQTHPKAQKAPNNGPSGSMADYWDVSPFDDYNDKVLCLDLFAGAGWQILNTTANGKTFVRKPSTRKGQQSGNVKDNIAYLHSTSTNVTANKGLTPFSLYCELHHGRDRSAGAKAIIADGYGVRSENFKSEKNLKEGSRVRTNLDGGGTNEVDAVEQVFQQILATSKYLHTRKKEKIVFSDPIINLNGNGFIWPKTMTTIQGQSGSHKSRLAETIAGALLSPTNHQMIGFQGNPEIEKTIIYVDTERNLTDQLPYALQTIERLANLDSEKKSDLPHFDHYSLLECPRKMRIAMISRILTHIRNKFHNHLVIVLDVLSDCISNFNGVEETLELIDQINLMINKQDCTFISVIHENPGRSKARGHLGTELINKSSVVMSIKIDDSGVIENKFIKTRMTRRPEPQYYEYSEDGKRLVLADMETVEASQADRYRKADIDTVIELIETQLSHTQIPKKTITNSIVNACNCSYRTAQKRLKKAIETPTEWRNAKGELCKIIERKCGRTFTLDLEPVNAENYPKQAEIDH